MNSDYKLKFYILMTLFGIILEILFFVAVDKFNTSSPQIILLFFLPLIFSLIGFFLDFRINKKIDNQDIFKHKFFYFGLFLGIIFFLIPILFHFLHIDIIVDFIQIPINYLIIMLCNEDFLSSCASEVAAYYIFFIYPLFFSLIGLLIDFMRSKINQNKIKDAS